MDETGVIDAPEVEVEPVEAEVEQPAEKPEGEQTTDDKDPYTTKFSREMRAALKEWGNDPRFAKFANQARDNHARLFALNQLEPRGIDGIRERYQLLDSLALGEQRGPEALTAMQEQFQQIEQLDNMILASDPKAFESLGPEMMTGLAKLTPHFLDQAEKINPDAVNAAILPRLIRELASGGIIKEFNDLIDVLNAQNDPRFDDKTKMQFARQQLAKMGELFNGLHKKAGEIAAPAQAKDTPDRLEQERQQFHWDSKIKPEASTFENKKFDELFAPYDKRLKLSETAKADLLGSFKQGMEKAGRADQNYMRQIGIYRQQKNPDPATVTNFVKNAVSRHAPSVLKSIVEARYGSFLAGKPATPASTPKTTAPPVTVNGKQTPVRIVSQKPPMDQIDHKKTPLEWLPMKQYRLYNGQVVRVAN